MAMLRSTNIAIMIIIIVILIVVIVVVEISLFWECVYIINRNHIESTSLLLYFGIPFFAVYFPPSPSFCFILSVSSSFQNSHRARYCVALFSLDKFRKFWGCSMNINFEINVDFVFACACWEFVQRRKGFADRNRIIAQPNDSPRISEPFNRFGKK